MTRSEALSPLKPGEGRFNVTAGIAIRGQLKKGAILYGIDFYEEKGFLESVLVFRGPREVVRAFMEDIRRQID